MPSSSRYHQESFYFKHEEVTMRGSSMFSDVSSSFLFHIIKSDRIAGEQEDLNTRTEAGEQSVIFATRDRIFSLSPAVPTSL